jgi:hypothetical protein
MSPLFLPRCAAGLLTFSSAAVGLLVLAPAAIAADLPAPTVSATTVTPGGSITIAGTGCTEPRAEEGVPFAGVIVQGDAGLELGDGLRAAADGSWSITTSVGAGSTLGTHVIQVTCDQYDENVAYPPVTVTVGTATAAPAPAPKPLAGGDRTTANKLAADTPFLVGERFSVRYSGFQPFEEVTLVLRSTPQNVGTFTADADGVLTVSFRIPTGSETGNHTLTFSGSLGTQFVQNLTIGSSRSLAYTGADVTMPLVIGSSLILAGGGLLVATRRRGAGASQA